MVAPIARHLSGVAVCRMSITFTRQITTHCSETSPPWMLHQSSNPRPWLSHSEPTKQQSFWAWNIAGWCCFLSRRYNGPPEPYLEQSRVPGIRHRQQAVGYLAMQEDRLMGGGGPPWAQCCGHGLSSQVHSRPWPWWKTDTGSAGAHIHPCDAGRGQDPSVSFLWQKQRIPVL